MSSPVLSSPFLVCDPQSGVTSYIVYIDDYNTEVPARILSDGKGQLYFDLEPLNLSNGWHRARVAAKNNYGTSNFVIFDFKWPRVSNGKLRIRIDNNKSFPKISINGNGRFRK
ncbi:MAG: hypothetical protein ACTSQN_18270 [Candidatus Heimdallarchaeota archaeon]